MTATLARHLTGVEQLTTAQTGALPAVQQTIPESISAYGPGGVPVARSGATPDPVALVDQWVAWWTATTQAITQSGTHLVGAAVRLCVEQPWVVPFAIIAALALITGVGVARTAAAAGIRRWRHGMWAQGARVVTITPPPEADPAGAVMFWSVAVDALARPWWNRWVWGQPHLSFEYAWAGRSAGIRVWVPGGVPPGVIEYAATTAWPGAAVTTNPRPARAHRRTTWISRLSAQWRPGTTSASSSSAAEQPSATANGATGSPTGGSAGAVAVPTGGVRPALPAGAMVAAGRLTFTRHPAYPLQLEHKVDPLRPLLGIGAATAAADHALVQILARPASPRRRAQASRALHARATGSWLAEPRTLGGRSGGLDTGAGWVGTAARFAARALIASLRLAVQLSLDILVAMLSTGRGRTGSAGRAGGNGATRTGPDNVVPASADPYRAGQVRALIDKASSPLLDVEIRYAAATTDQRALAGDPAAVEAATGRVRGRAHALATAFAIHTGAHNALRRTRLPRAAELISQRALVRPLLLSVTELAALAHLPLDVSVPAMPRAGARPAPAPPEIPTGGRGHIVLGDAEVGGHAVALPVADARQHLHVLGSTGTGKSTLLQNMILADARAGRGAILIDPHGDLVDDILDRLDPALADRIILFDPDQPYSPRINPLVGPDPDLAIDNLVGICRNIFVKAWGSRTDDVLRSACMTLLRRDDRPDLANLEHVPRLLNDYSFRKDIVGPSLKKTDQASLGAFWTWYDELGPAFRSQVIGPVLARLRAFLLRGFVRRTVGLRTEESGPLLDMKTVLDSKILLARLPKGILGEETCRLLGSFLMSLTWQAVTSRAAVPAAQRRDAGIYLDEFQNFLTLPNSFESICAEARKYRVRLVLAHQNLGQLDRDLRDGLSSNCRNKLFFTCSPEDAHFLERHTRPDLNEHDLTELAAFTLAARLIINGTKARAFTLRTRPGPAAGDGAKQIRTHCANRDRAAANPTPRDKPGEKQRGKKDTHAAAHTPRPSTQPPHDLPNAA